MPQTREKLLMSWSGGKDSALALHALLNDPRYEVTGLLTTIREEDNRATHHHIDQSLIEAQARSIGLSLHIVKVAPDTSPEEYARRMDDALAGLQSAGVTGVAFGDIFLEDLRDYRVEKLATRNLSAHFPLWKRETLPMAREFVALGFKAVACCVDTRLLDASFAGRDLDESFLDSLPEGVDACGENGEYHSFVYDGPIFRSPLNVIPGKRVTREHWCYCDVLPAGGWSDAMAC